MVYKFYDTCSLIFHAETAFQQENTKVVISSITVDELKSMRFCMPAAEQVFNFIKDNPNCCEIHTYTDGMLRPFTEKGYSDTTDIKILATAFDYDCCCHPDETVFVTNDENLQIIANYYFGSDSIVTC